MVRILRALGGGLFAPSLEAHRARRLAAHVGVSAPTVRARLASLRASGVLGPRVLLPDPALLARKLEYLLWEVPEHGKPEAIDRVLRLPEAMEVFDHVGPPLGVVLWSRSRAERERRVRAISAAIGTRPTGVYYDMSVPARARLLSPLDKRLLLALAKDPDASAEALGREMGITPRIARARLKAMHADGVFVIEQQLDRTRLGGATAAQFQVAFEGDVRRAGRAVADRLEPWLLSSAPRHDHPSVVRVFMVLAESLAHSEELRASVRVVPGVTRVVPFITRRYWKRYGEVQRAFEEELCA